MKKKTLTRFLAGALAGVMALSMAAMLSGCGKDGGQASNDGTGTTTPSGVSDDRTVIYYAAANVTAPVRDAYLELVDTYNNTQGVTDKVYVQMRDNPGDINGLDSVLRSNYMYDVVQISDNQYKALAMQGKDYFVSLDEYLTDDVKAAMDWDQIPDDLVNRFRMNTTPGANGLYEAGAGTSLLALPNGSDPQVLYYNKKLLSNAGINLISVSEEELDAYNTANNAKLMPHGYAEYKDAPFADAKSSKNEAGEFVYKVFNDRIAMNWAELRCLSRAFQTQYGCEYGFMSEWWFSMGWSVGSDCVGWDEDLGQYVMTLGDKKDNYLALSDITVNGTDYKAGDVLHYEDKAYLAANASELSALSGKVYALPSNYEATLEFNRLGVPANKEAEAGVNGYGVAPSNTQNRAARFTSGTDCPFLIEYYSGANSYKMILKDDVDIALPAQYREYVGGSTYQNGGEGFANEYLKVIGETYDGEVYTGELHYENGTAIVGESTTASNAGGFFLPANTKNKNYDAAFKFASWAAGPEGQAILAKGSTLVPNQSDLGMGSASEGLALPNAWAAAAVARKGDIGDYTYFTSVTWITEWSMLFNNDVRLGNVTFTDFLNAKQEVADTSLKGMRLRIYGR